MTNIAFYRLPRSLANKVELSRSTNKRLANTPPRGKLLSGRTTGRDAGPHTVRYVTDHPRSTSRFMRSSSARGKSTMAAQAAITVSPIDCKLPSLRPRRVFRPLPFPYKGILPFSLHHSMHPRFVYADRLWASQQGTAAKQLFRNDDNDDDDDDYDARRVPFVY